MDNLSIKKNIGDVRKEKKITQEELAQRTGMSRNSLREIEVGETRLISEKLTYIADALGVTPERLVLGYDPDGNNEILSDIRQSYDTLRKDSDKEIARLREELAVKDKLISTLEDLNASLKDNCRFLREKLDECRQTEKIAIFAAAEKQSEQ